MVSLRLLSRAWRVAQVLCDPMPSTALIDELLEERAAASAPTVIFLTPELIAAMYHQIGTQNK